MLYYCVSSSTNLFFPKSVIVSFQFLKISRARRKKYYPKYKWSRKPNEQKPK